ncbi:ferredoxin--NADP reductase [Nocardia altamirensis]|uniref:ferredoxin--NADP reductase n=1 Tax=Nocardia altamirensis TaxID=472158 RepID=UPI00083FECA8|nr:ferredoxin--NADP reductase [Nocardia altamirensis]
MNPRAHQVKICDVIVETADAVTLVFDIPEDLSGRFSYAPGQFLTLRVPSERTGSVARCYSLSSSPHCDDRLAVTIKRTAGGYASNWLCDNITAGTMISVLEPAGTCTPRSLDADLLLCAAGSGITPIMSIIRSVLTAGTGRVALLYANRESSSIIFAGELEQLAGRFPERLTLRHWLESEHGLPTVGGVADLLVQYRTRDIFLCGPAGFIDIATAAAAQLGLPQRNIHQEKYHSLTENPFEQPVLAPVRRATGDSATVRVDIDGETVVLEWPRNRKLLDVLLDNGLDAPYVCRESACGTCVCTVREGRTRMLMNESLIDDELAAGLTLACQTLPESDDLHIAFDQ